MEAKKNKIMLVDDSENLRQVLKGHFEMNGYEVYDYTDCNSAMQGFHSKMFHLCIIDLTLQTQDNCAVLQNIRKYDANLPVIILSDSTGKDDRIRCFRAGCDDYIAKPFCLEELDLRIKAILRRSFPSTENRKVTSNDKIYRLGNFLFNYSEMLLIHPKLTRTLTRKEAELLKLLCDHRNKLIPREIILKEVWGEEDHAMGRSMDVFLTKLRSYLQVDSADHIAPREKGKRKVQYLDNYEPLVEIKNVHGTGFMIKLKNEPANSTDSITDN